MIWIIIMWAILWAIHACTIEERLKEILAEIKKKDE